MRIITTSRGFRRFALGLAAGALCLTTTAVTARAGETEATVDVAIVLDVSGSMRGLIDAAKFKLWEIVNDLSTAEPAPRLRVALLTFGNQSGSAATGWARVETDFTEDLDRVSELLFALRTRGADEYLGRVLKLAIEELSWTEADNGLRLLFVAGNESPDQDPLVDYRQMALEAPAGEIHLTSVFCGVEQAAAAPEWREMAELAVGTFATIDHRSRAILLRTPYDEELVELGDLLSETYIAPSGAAAERKASQLRQDANARRSGLPVAASRAVTKSGRYYAPGWDLANAYRQGNVDLEALEPSELPAQLQRMSSGDRMYYLEDLLAAREELQARIAELGRERRDFVGEKLRQMGVDESRAFDHVVRTTIRRQAEALGLYFESK